MAKITKRARMFQRSKRTTILLPTECHDWLKKKAAKRRLTVSDIIRELLDERVKERP